MAQILRFHDLSMMNPSNYRELSNSERDETAAVGASRMFIVHRFPISSLQPTDCGWSSGGWMQDRRRSSIDGGHHSPFMAQNGLLSGSAGVSTSPSLSRGFVDV
ncbi:hypothetical protein Dimus_005788, partial [Dionaea muscipula]